LPLTVNFTLDTQTSLSCLPYVFLIILINNPRAELCNVDFGRSRHPPIIWL